jgi:hypothetical protein
MKHGFVRFAGVAALLAGTVPGAELHVTPGAPDTGQGSRSRFLDIATALSARSPAKPGDTIWLAGGTYTASDVGATPGVFEVSVSGQRDQRIQIRPEKGACVHLNGAVSFSASWTDLIGVDIGRLDWTPETGGKAKDALTAARGTNSRVINCNIFGGRHGISAWEGARNLEIYGCLIHDFGYIEGPGRGHGHAFYSQNMVADVALLPGERDSDKAAVRTYFRKGQDVLERLDRGLFFLIADVAEDIRP